VTFGLGTVGFTVVGFCLNVRGSANVDYLNYVPWEVALF